MNCSRKYAGYIYLIGSSRFGWYKIGKSKEAIARIQDIGILLPFKVEIFAIWGSNSFHLVEQMMHVKYADHHINGEWFSFDEKELRIMVEDDQPLAAQRIFLRSRDEVSCKYAFSNISEDKLKPFKAISLSKIKKELIKAETERLIEDYGLEEGCKLHYSLAFQVAMKEFTLQSDPEYAKFVKNMEVSFQWSSADIKCGV